MNSYDEQWLRRVNWELATGVERDGINRVLASHDWKDERGIVWFPNHVRYKILDGAGAGTELRDVMPRRGALQVQYNLSRGAPRGGDRDRAPTSAEPCVFCDALSASELRLATFPGYVLVADSRPFFRFHMLLLSGGHRGHERVLEVDELKGLLDVLWTHFPGRRGNVGTGNAAAHLHIHIYDTEFPVETQRVEWCDSRRTAQLGTVVAAAGVRGVVIETRDVNDLSAAAHEILRRVELLNLLPTILAAPPRLYILPQRKKTITADFGQKFLGPFLDQRPAEIRPRYVGPVEAAGIWLCYSRGDVGEMERMYAGFDRTTYTRILQETGLPYDFDCRGRLLSTESAEGRS